MKRFVVRDERSIDEVLRALGEDEGAVSEGRVFVGRSRVTRIERSIAVGEEVLVHPPRVEIALPEPFVLHHREGLLAVDKPAGIPTIADVRGAQGTLVDLAARALGIPASELHPTSRLDREVSGVVVFALDRRAREELAVAREDRRYHRRYTALARGELPDRARLTWAIARAKDPKLRRAGEDGEPAATRIAVVERSAAGLLVAAAPETGRTHQIRVHLAKAGAPILGDRVYGGVSRVTSATGKVAPASRIALHCARVSISLPRCMIEVLSPVPPELIALAEAVGLRKFAEVLTCEV